MDKEITQIVASLFRMARKDPEYANMGEQYTELEEKFSQMISQLPRESQDIAWAFLCHSEAMNWRMLEIICEKMGLWRGYGDQ